MNLRNSMCAAALFFPVCTLSFAANTPGSDHVSEQVKAQALANYGRRPLSFEENRGQTDARVKYLAHGSGYSILLAPSEVVLNLQSKTYQSSIRMGFPGAKSSAALTGSERQSAVSSYFIGNDSAKWVPGAPNFARVHYHELYPGIDLAFYGNQGRLEYDFVVAPGADPAAIRLAFDGVEGLRIDSAGDLVVSTAAGEIRQHKPIVYQESAGLRQTIAGKYVLQPHNRVAFEVGKYDARKPLIVDPILSFATYLGSPGDELDFGISAAASQATYPAIAVDKQGNIYVTGFNGGSATSFVGHPTNLGIGADVFVVKMSPTGGLLYDVVFGGGLLGIDFGGGIAVDSSGNAYVTGYTSNTNFPVTGGVPQSSNQGLINAFVTKLNSAGTALVYSTYLGGSGSFWGRGIAVDPSGNAYVTGTASASGSTPFPLVSPLSSTPSSGFLTEVNAAGTAFQYSTYLAAGIGYGIAVDSIGDAYVTGSTGTSSAPSPSQGYVLKIKAGGGLVGYGPILLGNSGASLQTVGFGIALDSSDNAYVAGMTSDPNFPQISSAAQPVYGGGLTDGFAVKLNSGGSLVYGTYMGGIGSNLIPERASGIGVDQQGNAYVSGTTECIGYPVINAVPGLRNGAQVVLMEGTVSGTTSTWTAATLGGDLDEVTALAFDPSGNLYAGTSAVNAAGGGVYKLSGGTWSFASTGIATTTVDAVAVDPTAPSTVYAAGGLQLYKTTNGGGGWTLLSQAVGTAPAIAVAATSPSTVYVGSSSGLVYSTNGGTTWSSPTTPPSGAVLSLVVDPNNVATAYAGTAAGAYKTVNGGATWSAVNVGLPSVSGVFLPVTSMAINALTATVYAATPNGLFYTTNGGSNWNQEAIGQVASTPLLVAVDSGNNVYVAFDGAGIATGTGGGTSVTDWSALTYNGLTHNQIMALAVPPNSSGTAYAGLVQATTAFLTEISPSGNSFVTSSCIGGSDNNLGQGIAVAPSGAAFVSGATIATNFPATPGALQPASAGLYDDFIVGDYTNTAAAITSSPSGASITVTGTGCTAGTYTTPAYLVWNPGISCTVSFADPQTFGGVSYEFQSSTVNGSAIAHTNPLTVASGGITLAINATYVPVTGTTPSTATHFSVTALGSATAGYPIQFTVTALNASNNVVTTYTDPVHFTSSDPAAAVPGDSTLTNGVGTFSASLVTAGSTTLTASDLLVPSINGTSAAIAVSQSTAGLYFVPITPCRVVDTRDSTKPVGFGPPAIGADQTRSFAIPDGPCSGIPGNVQAYALNVTVIPDGDLGYLTVWPTGQTQPYVSTLNSTEGEVKANAAIVAAGTGAEISVFATNETNVVLDINGYFVPNNSASSLAFYPMTPCRLVDTRPGAPSTVSSGALAPDTVRTLPLQSSSCNVPSTAQAYSLNFTLVPTGPVGYLSVWPAGQNQPVVSTLNDPTGTVEANAGIIPAGTPSGSIDVYATNTTNLLVDINGYFAPTATGGLSLYALPPCRVLDSRTPAGSLPFVGTINVNVIGSDCGGTSAAQAYVFNATVVPEGFLGFLTLWPEGGMQPVVSTLNAYNGVVTSNLAIVPTTNTQISAYALDSTFLVLDMFGYFAP